MIVVLPAFNVTLIPQDAHFSLDGQELKVEVHARYVYGEKVKGVAYVVFGVEKNGEKVRLPSMKQVNNLDGGTAILTIDELRKAYSNINSLVGSSIYIKASVLTNSGSDLVEAEKSGIKIVLAPYVLAIKDTSKFYKSGLPFDMTAETLVQGLREEQQTKANWIVQPYTPFNPKKPNQLHIMLDKYTGQAGQTLNFQLHLSTFSEKEKNFLQHVSYIVLNKGRIIRTGKIDIKGHEITNFPQLLTSEMMPAFRFVVYYILPWSSKIEVVSDSILVAVESNCVGSLKVEPLAGEVMSSYSPGDSLSFQVRGDPGAKVSLVAVDNSVFLLSKGRLTQKKSNPIPSSFYSAAAPMA
ncbi:complement component c3b, tandem duplicate 2 isoform X2 [Silurus asotus]|uniref:Complement component c3b, tandem duplicate 2 isoform X2 n=1 Tax=Silurus asotus TaxID=30991 RepID=A0AAD5B607_SILAS|nr:complement component c3b, tandem duplicate 2 isoform X2 [Silurus asotus]